ncbi:hypothetical protein BGY98DRAFT_514470 [Russula aff. rugulosa BPL654]|nr:hypothetical protein BGY98DRAFT_514470 [Russula aff. rugulosa BPL654]
MTELTEFWCHVQGKHSPFTISIALNRRIDHLRTEIFNKLSDSIERCGVMDLTLTKVDVDISEASEQIEAGQYQPTPNDQVLSVQSLISEFWPEPPPDDRLHIFVGIPDRIGSPLPRNTQFFARTRDLWAAVTIYTTSQGDFGGPGCLELNEIAEVYPGPEFITEFRNKLGQRRWIESEPCRSRSQGGTSQV